MHHFTVSYHQTFFSEDKDGCTVTVIYVRYEEMLKTFFRIEMSNWAKTILISTRQDHSTPYQFGHSVFKTKIRWLSYRVACCIWPNSMWFFLVGAYESKNVFNACSWPVRLSTHSLTSVWLVLCTTFAICTIYVIHATSYPRMMAVRTRCNILHHQFDLSSSFQWEVLYKICTILYLIYPKIFKNLEDSQNLHKPFSKMI